MSKRSRTLDKALPSQGLVLLLAVSPGCSSLINHSKLPNAYFVRDYRLKRLKIYTLRHIDKGEEITIDYGYAVKF